jgi:hypothetical protein
VTAGHRLTGEGHRDIDSREERSPTETEDDASASTSASPRQHHQPPPPTPIPPPGQETTAHRRARSLQRVDTPLTPASAGPLTAKERVARHPGPDRPSRLLAEGGRVQRGGLAVASAARGVARGRLGSDELRRKQRAAMTAVMARRDALAVARTAAPGSPSVRAAPSGRVQPTAIRSALPVAAADLVSESVHDRGSPRAGDEARPRRHYPYRVSSDHTAEPAPDGAGAATS